VTLRLHVTGASGAGTSTLGAALATALGGRHVDADDHYWRPTEPPFTHKRDPAARLAGVLAALATPIAILAGSVVGWGPALEDSFDRIVFLYVDADVRVARLQQREVARHGKADPAFLAWAAQYDAGPPEGRSLAKHRAWLAARACLVLELRGEATVEDHVAAVTRWLANR